MTQTSPSQGPQPPVPPGTVQPSGPQAKQPGDALAKGALVTGVIGAVLGMGCTLAGALLLFRGSLQTGVFLLIIGTGLGILVGLVAAAFGLIALIRGTRRMGMAIGGTALGGIAIVGTILLLLPALSRAREIGKLSICAVNLKRIGTGVFLYMAANNDAPPPTLDALVRNGLISAEMLKCPSGKGGRASDYFYLPPPPGAAPGSLMACEFNNHPRDGRWVALADCQVKILGEPDFQALLAKPENATFAAALRQAEGP